MQISLIASVIFLLTLYFENITSTGLDQSKEDDIKYSAPIWFGPRIGRKKKDYLDGYKNVDIDELDNLLNFIRRSPWTIMLFNNGKNRLMQFNPKERGSENFGDDEITEMVRRSMFAPRLGRGNDFN